MREGAQSRFIIRLSCRLPPRLAQIYTHEQFSAERANSSRSKQFQSRIYMKTVVRRAENKTPPVCFRHIKFYTFIKTSNRGALDGAQTYKSDHVETQMNWAEDYR